MRGECVISSVRMLRIKSSQFGSATLKEVPLNMQDCAVITLSVDAEEVIGRYLTDP